MAIKTLSDVYGELEKDRVNLHTKYQYSAKKTGNRTTNMSLGRIWFNLILPDGFTLIDEPVTREKSDQIFVELLNQFGPGQASETITILNKETFKLATIDPVSFTAENLILSENIKSKKDKKLANVKDPVEFGKKRDEIGKEYLAELKSKKDGLSDIVESGSKSNATDVGVLLIAKGSTVDIDNNVSEPINNSVNDGFNLDEYHKNAGEARKLLHIRSIGASEPGTISRFISYATSGIILYGDDCGTRKYFELKGRENQDRLLGRYWLNQRNNKEEMVTSDIKLPAGKIKLRSPLYCKSKKGICKTCYGDLSNRIQNNNIGLVAANVMGKIGVETFSMKARHQSSQISVREVDFEKDMIK